MPVQFLPKGRVISKAFPARQPIHQDHYLAFGPDDWLYLNQGAESNTGCSSYGNITRCAILRLRSDGSQLQIFARGQTLASLCSLRSLPLNALSLLAWQCLLARSPRCYSLPEIAGMLVHALTPERLPQAYARDARHPAGSDCLICTAGIRNSVGEHLISNNDGLG